MEKLVVVLADNFLREELEQVEGGDTKHGPVECGVHWDAQRIQRPADAGDAKPQKLRRRFGKSSASSSAPSIPKKKSLGSQWTRTSFIMAVINAEFCPDERAATPAGQSSWASAECPSQ